MTKYDRSIKNIKPKKYSLNEEKYIINEIRNGNNKLKDEFVKNYIIYSKKIATKYIKKNGIHTLDDLIQEGNIGIMIAINKFDLSKNIKFSTYSTFWIKQRILLYTSTQETIKIPQSVVSDRRLINKCELNNDIIDICNKTRLKEFQVIRVKNLLSNRIDIDKYNDNNLSYNNNEIDMYNFIDEAMYSLTFREKELITLYYLKKMKIKEISIYKNISEKTVSNILKIGMERLKNESNRLYNNYIENN